MSSILITGGRILDPGRGLDYTGDLLVIQGKVAEVGINVSLPGIPRLDARGMMVCPGFIDLHCHLREPGYEEKETISTGTRAAARGGFTTICCMPNTMPPIDSPDTVDYIKQKSAAGGIVRVLPIGCITKGRKGIELAGLAELARAGVAGYSDDGSPVLNSELLRRAMEITCNMGLPIIEHCEDTKITHGGAMNEGEIALRLGLPGMPAAAEEAMVERDIALAQKTGAHLHIAHVSTEGSTELVRRAKERGIRVTAEVTPHHLTLSQEAVAKRSGTAVYDTNAKVNPPLRTTRDISALIEALREGIIDAIATDHAPHAAGDKSCSFEKAAFGISGLETALGSLMGLVHQGGLTLNTLVRTLTAGPAGIIKTCLSKQTGSQGSLKPGVPGDVTIFDPDMAWIVNPEDMMSKGKNTPLAGHRMRGKVMATIVGGKVVYQDRLMKLNELT